MPDDYNDLKTQADEAQDDSDTPKFTSWWIGRWAHIISLIVFISLYVLFLDKTWGWPLAATVAYIIFMFCCTCGLSFQDSDEFIGSPEVMKYMAVLLVRQIVVLAVISLCLFLWRYAIPFLPIWATARGSHGLTLWEYVCIIVFYFVAVREAKWMAKKIKARFPEIHEPLDFIEPNE